MLDALSASFDTEFVRNFLHIARVTSPLWITAFVVGFLFDIWIELKRREWVRKQGSVLLEIKLPREMSKSPQAMELFLNTLYNPISGSLIKVYVEGAMRPWFSLELVSIGGSVHFFIWCHEGYRRRVEAQLYAQFPNIEIHEASDYSLGVHRDPEKITFGWFGQFALTKPDPYPIKTYVDYGLDKDPKEEFKNDPLVAVLEFLGSMRKGEQAWIQILIRAHTKEGLKLGRIITKPDWRDNVKKEIKKILKEGILKDKDDKTVDSTKHLSQGQKDVISAIERTTGKTAFDTMIRATYFADKEVYSPTNIGGLIGSMSQFGSGALNGFKPGFSASFEYPWQDPFGKEKAQRERQLLEAYKRRSFFAPPFKNFNGKPFILTTEELATIFHFPGGVAATPTLQRIPSKKAEAPANLPI
ncbi:hypothetical protein KW796_00960 [Candidatus Parcubacteria bacterium]|nr:hypothetical protein [Candidatus Parcubacteria bacterium]